MSKTSTDAVRHTLNGPTMGSRWTAVFYAAPGLHREPLQMALQTTADQVDAQMSTWRDDSELMRLNQVPVGMWCPTSPELLHVLTLGLAVGRTTRGAFDIGMGDATQAWGFGRHPADAQRIRLALQAQRRPAYELLEVSGQQVRKTGPITLDLNGIAKGYGVDRLAEVLKAHGVQAALVGIDGEMRALGLRPDNEPWAIAIEAPDPECRTAHAILSLESAAVATSGDYRHWVEVGERRLAHTMDPHRRAPLSESPASVTVVAASCAEADAWATALMVLGAEEGKKLAMQQGISALFLLRSKDQAIWTVSCGPVFA